MKERIGWLLGTLLMTCLVAAGPLGASESSVELGKKLFNDKALGGSTNDNSCNSCHPDGKGLEKAGTRKGLEGMINQCVAGPLKGTKLDESSSEMQSLKMYIESLGK